MPMYRWSDLEEVELNPLIYGRIVEVPNAMVARIRAPKGNSLNMHVHDFDQVTNMVSGKIRWHIDGEEPRICEAGDVMWMPAGVAHGGEVLEDCEYIDVFAPGRQDFGWYKQRMEEHEAKRASKLREMDEVK
ncbi:Cupin domain-containing protein [Xaviernesmea oryzae]|uniref:Cupin domain-containing protein n=1 Tax=Xaviernesmea oryzae TaxID=464029 RepID=A0A1X7E0Z3_9HYPH|nr:cupin domain-containing protein [Xaviernesmea oryzae]SMF25487.1 Cupin domain-containing protein [Xaviernesmea oryzae]